MAGVVVKLGTVSVDRNLQLVFERDSEGDQWRHMLRVKKEYPNTMELSTGISGGLTWFKRRHGKRVSSTMEEGGESTQPGGQVQLGTVSIVAGDCVELACDPDWVEQQLEVKIRVREKARNVVEIRCIAVEVFTAAEILLSFQHDPRPWDPRQAASAP